MKTTSKRFMCPQVIAMAMDVFTDVDIFKEIITATLRGVAVYVLLDDSHFAGFLAMSRRAGINIQDLKASERSDSARLLAPRPGGNTVSHFKATPEILWNIKAKFQKWVINP